VTDAIALGVFARCFPVAPATELAATVADHGFTLTQLNLSAVGLPTIPDAETLAGIDLSRIADDFRAGGVGVWGLSGSYNMAHPDASLRSAWTRDAAALVRRAGEAGATAVTLCTGSRDPENMWRAHPDNATDAAWSDFLECLAPLLDAAEEADVLLAVEPEPGNVVSGTDAAVRLVGALGERASRVGFILDPANLVAGAAPADRADILTDAFARLGDAAICVHAKDVVPWDARLAGAEGLDFGFVRALHAGLPHRVPIIIQDADSANMRAVRALVVGG
jgi:sugar phosphate isomerase/epimerase